MGGRRVEGGGWETGEWGVVYMVEKSYGKSLTPMRLSQA